jgi:hypothetical protein
LLTNDLSLVAIDFSVLIAASPFMISFVF